MALAIAVALAVRTSRAPYEVHLRFESAGQLIEGNVVEVAGVRVGRITKLELTDDGLADIRIRIDDERYRPLHRGTTAGIGTVGASGVTNRYVTLSPGPTTGAKIRDGGVLGLSETRPIVDIDQVLNAFTPPVRRDLQRATQDGAEVLHHNVTNTRRTIRYASAAMSRVEAFASELTADRNAFSTLLSSGATTAGVLAERAADLQLGVRTTARTFAAIADERTALERQLANLPPVLRRSTAVLRDLRPTLRALDPVLRDARPVARPLATVLRELVPTARAARPVITRMTGQLPGLRAALDEIPATAEATIPALERTAKTLTDITPIYRGMRPYAQDMLQAQIHGLGGNVGYNYDANGNYARIGFGLSPSSLLTGALGTDLQFATPSILTQQTRRCPGAAAQAPADGSAPLVTDPPTCDPTQVTPK